MKPAGISLTMIFAVFSAISLSLIASADQRLKSEKANVGFGARVSTLTSRIEGFIAKDLVEKRGYDEIVESRRYTSFDLDHDHSPDVILITSFGNQVGGNYTDSSVLVALTSRPEKVFYVKVGGRGSRYAKRMYTVSSGLHLYVDFVVYGRHDAECCPSLRTTEELRFDEKENALVFIPYDQLIRKRITVPD